HKSWSSLLEAEPGKALARTNADGRNWASQTPVIARTKQLVATLHWECRGGQAQGAPKGFKRVRGLTGIGSDDCSIERADRYPGDKVRMNVLLLECLYHAAFEGSE